MHPPFPGCQALFAALRVGRDRPDFLDVRTGVRGHVGSPTGVGRIALGRYDRPCHSSFRYSCTNWTAMAPSPTAEATRLTEPERTSPAANTPVRLVSSRNGWRRAVQWGAFAMPG